PGMPNVAAAMARRLAHINGYAEGTDGAVFVSGMISLGFVETDTREIVRKAAKLISPLSPYRECLDQVIAMAEAGSRRRFTAASKIAGVLSTQRPTMPFSMAESLPPASGSVAATSSRQRISRSPLPTSPILIAMQPMLPPS